MVGLAEGGYRSLGRETAFAEREAMRAIVDLLPATAEQAVTTAEVLDRLGEQGVKRNAATDALSKLTEACTIRRTGEGRRGLPYAYHKPAFDAGE